MSDNEDTIIQDDDHIQMLLSKYNQYDLPTSASINQPYVEESAQIQNTEKDDLDEILAELKEKYNIDFDKEPEEGCPTYLTSNILPEGVSNGNESEERCLQSSNTFAEGFTKTKDSASLTSNLFTVDLTEDIDPGEGRPKYLTSNSFAEEVTSDNLPRNKSTETKPKRQASTNKDEKMRLQMEKKMEREKKKEEAQREKELKKVFAATNKNLRPENCIKFVTAIVDTSILEQSLGSEITKSLNALGANCKVSPQLVPNSITWTRKVQSHLINGAGKLSLTEGTETIEEILLIMDWKEVVEHVKRNSLLAYVKGLPDIFGKYRVSLCLFGMDTYFKKFRNKSDAPTINRHELEFSLTELQLMCNCCCRLVETSEEVGAMVSQFTKAIALQPHKLQQLERNSSAEWYMSGDNKDCVRVDQDGNGLKRLWQQNLTSFPLTRIETAEAIISKYPTLKDLLQAYDQCSSTSEKEKLLQDIPIRRNAGPVSNVRRIGPELSRKICIYYNSVNGEEVLQ